MRILSLITMLFLGLSCLADNATVVDGARVNLRSGRADTFRVIKSLSPGTRVEIIHDETGYLKVKTATGEVGWLPARMLNIETNSAPLEVPNPMINTLQTQLTQLRTELTQSRGRQMGFASWVVVSAAVLGVIFGGLLGMGGLRAYYQKRLKGLRI